MIVPDIAFLHQIKPTSLLCLENSFLFLMLSNIFITLHLNVQQGLKLLQWKLRVHNLSWSCNIFLEPPVTGIAHLATMDPFFIYCCFKEIFSHWAQSTSHYKPTAMPAAKNSLHICFLPSCYSDVVVRMTACSIDQTISCPQFSFSKVVVTTKPHSFGVSMMLISADITKLCVMFNRVS